MCWLSHCDVLNLSFSIHLDIVAVTKTVTGDRHLRFVDEDLLRLGRLPDVPDADDGAAVQTHGAGLGRGPVD